MGNIARRGPHIFTLKYPSEHGMVTYWGHMEKFVGICANLFFVLHLDILLIIYVLFNVSFLNS